MRHLKRRAAVSVAILAAMLAITSVCVYLRKDAPRAESAVSTRITAEQDDPVTRFRTEREMLRNRQLGELNEIIHDSLTDAETVNLAKRQLMALMKSQEQELLLEGVLSAKGFDGALVTVSDAAVNVILKDRTPTRQENAMILDLILRETGVTAGNVKILTINP